jgi:hypothetical protein
MTKEPATPKRVAGMGKSAPRGRADDDKNGGGEWH